MKVALRILFWCIVFVGMCLLFCVTDTEGAWGDSRTDITLLSDEGETVLSLDQYLLGALGAEMPAEFETEALKAQAVAIRSYILAGTRHGDKTVCTDSSCCIGYRTLPELYEQWGAHADAYLRKLRGAIRSTDGEYLTYEGQAAQAVFHASSSGTTENSAALWNAVPYLISVDTPETEESVSSSVCFSPGELADALGLSQAPEAVGSIAYEPSGRVRSAEFGGVLFSGPELRSRLGLAGTDFDVCFDGESFVFTVRGKGHGIGMSQTGADIYAAEGWDYQAILAHYYPGTELASLCPPAP